MSDRITDSEDRNALKMTRMQLEACVRTNQWLYRNCDRWRNGCLIASTLGVFCVCFLFMVLGDITDRVHYETWCQERVDRKINRISGCVARESELVGGNEWRCINQMEHEAEQ